MVAAVRFHHDIPHAPEEAMRLAGLVFAANVIAYRLNLGSGFPDYAVHPNPAFLEPIGLQPGDLADYENEVLTTFKREQARVWEG
jgi:hypothetical protein